MPAARRAPIPGGLTNTPVIDSVLPLEKVGEAHRRLEGGGVKGKIVLQVVEE